MNDIIFNRTKGGLARTLPNEDHISGLVFPFDQPTSWTTTKVRQFKSLAQIEAADITEFDIIFGLTHYQAKEFFRNQPNGTLWLAFNPTSNDQLATATSGKVRQWGFYGTTSGLSQVQPVLDALTALKAPAVAVFGVQQSSTTLATAGVNSIFSPLVVISVLVSGLPSAIVHLLYLSTSFK
jgi:hypothetical protein